MKVKESELHFWDGRPMCVGLPCSSSLLHGSQLPVRAKIARGWGDTSPRDDDDDRWY